MALRGNPVAVVFAREATPEVAALLKKLESAIEKNIDSALEDYDPPERDCEPEDDGYYDDDPIDPYDN